MTGTWWRSLTAYLKSPVSIGSTMMVPSSPVLMLLYLLRFSVIMEKVCSFVFCWSLLAYGDHYNYPRNLCIVVQKKNWKKIGRCWNFVLKSITFHTQWFRYAMRNVVHENFLFLVKCELFASGLCVFKLWSGRRHLHDSFNKQSDWRFRYYWEGLGSSWTFVSNLCSCSYGRNYLIQWLMK